MLARLKLARRWLVGFLFLTAIIGLAAVFSTRSASGGETADRTVARGGGTTIIQGGTRPLGGFIPVLTTIAFHAEKTGGAVTGSLECLPDLKENSIDTSPCRCLSDFCYYALCCTRFRLTFLLMII